MILFIYLNRHLLRQVLLSLVGDQLNSGGGVSEVTDPMIVYEAFIGLGPIQVSDGQ